MALLYTFVAPVASAAFVVFVLAGSWLLVDHFAGNGKVSNGGGTCSGHHRDCANCTITDVCDVEPPKHA